MTILFIVHIVKGKICYTFISLLVVVVVVAFFPCVCMRSLTWWSKEKQTSKSSSTKKYWTSYYYFTQSQRRWKRDNKHREQHIPNRPYMMTGSKHAWARWNALKFNSLILQFTLNWVLSKNILLLMANVCLRNPHMHVFRTINNMIVNSSKFSLLLLVSHGVHFHFIHSLSVELSWFWFVS